MSEIKKHRCIEISSFKSDVFYTIFPGGEVHSICSLGIYSIDSCVMNIKISNSNDIIHLLQVTEILRRNNGINSIELIMTYAPYAQQDRVCNDYESLTSKVFSELINAQNYQSVTVLDCHSDVMPALLNNCTNISPINLVARLPFDEDTYLICPDSGALKRIYNISTGINKIKGIVRADKRRDTMTGKITGTEVLHENLNGAKCIIVDDICVGGATFINLSKELKNKGAGEILLYVTHGIFSNGLDCLFDSGIDAIYTTNSRNRNEELNSKLNILII